MFVAASLRGAGALAAIALAIAASRLLSTTDSAHFFFLTSLGLMLAVILRWGMDELIVRHVATAIDKVAAARELLREAHARVFLATAFATPVVVIAWLATPLSEASLALLLSLIAGAFFSALASCIGRVLQGYELAQQSIFVLVVAQPLLLVLGILALAGTGKLGLTSAACLYFGSGLLSYAFALRLLPQEIGNVIWSRRSTSTSAFPGASKLGFAVLAQQGNVWLISVLPAYLFQPAAYGDLVVAQKVAAIVGFPGLVLNYSLATKVAREQHGLAGFDARRSTVRFVSIVAGASLVGLACCMLVAPSLMSFAARKPSVVLLALLACAQVFGTVVAALSSVLVMQRRESSLHLLHLLCTGLAGASLVLASQRWSMEFALALWACWMPALGLILLLKSLSRDERT